MRRGRLLALLVLLLAGRGGWAQIVNLYSAAVSVGAYVPVTGTLLSAASSSTTLDSYVGVIPANTIPFAFTFAGNNVSTGTVNVSSNGFLTFGATPTTSTTLYTPISSTTAFGGVIAPFARDLNARYSTTAGQNGEIRYSVEGTAPNREFVVQWSNFRPYTTSTTNYLVWNFQVRLAETTNVVSIVYSPDAPVGTGQTGTAQVGLRGTSEVDYKNFLINTANPWTAPAPGTANSSTASYSATLQPAVGQTYTFTPPVACAGVPTPGTVAVATATICAGASSQLSLSGTTVASGLSYQWQSASSSTGPFANISGATGTSYLAAPLQTTYYQVVVTCANGGSPVSATSNVVAVTVTPATYATLPAAEGFEAAWTTACTGTNSLPSNSWRNTPPTGNNSWRRNDDGTSANWTSTSGNYTPGGSNAGGATSTYSARFHSYNASSGAVGNLDYYLDLSAAGSKRLIFDYINADGTDKLNVLLSTDGGATFGTTAIVQQTTAAAWTRVVVDFAATSATSVLRFQATSDFGDSDIGLDNVTVLVTPALDVQPTALVAPAATTATTCYSSTEAVTVTVRNAGSAAIDFSATPLAVTVNVTGAVTQALTTTVNTNAANGGSPLAAGATVNITLPTTLNMTTVGTYTLAATATVPGDGNPANDALGPQTRTVAAPVAGTLTSATTAVCVSGTARLTLTGATGGGIQLQSSPDNVTFTDIAGATSATYTTPVLTSTTYFRAQVRCNTGTATSGVVTIRVNNPQVASVSTPVSACAGSPATLTATASAGSSVRFFSAATGGTALGTGSPFTTSAVTATTTFYAEAFVAGSESVGKASTNGADGTNNSGALYFTATAPTTIATVTVYQTATAGAGTATIQLLSGSVTSGTPLQQQVVTLPANTTGALLAVPVTLNFVVPAAGAYSLNLSASTTALVRDYSSAALPATAFPYTHPSGTVSITGGSLAGYYYFFYNWQVNTECVNPTRTAIQVNVTQPAAASFSYPATGSNCAGSTGTVAATLATGATAGTFTSTTGLTLDATTGAVNLATSTAGTYTVTNTVAATGTGSCPGTATATITVNPTPARPTLTATYNGTQTTLTSSAATGNQFYFNGTAIAGATGQSYVVNGSATTYGPYTVVVTNSFGCSSPASVATVVTTTRVGIAGASVRLYPNPTPNGQLTLELSGLRSATQLAVVDALGRVVRSEQLPATAGVVTHQLNLSAMASGVYLLRLTNADGIETRRLVRE